MKRFAIAVASLLTFAGGTFTAWRFLPPGQTYFTDAATIKEPAAIALIRDVLWEPPVPLTEPINTVGETYEPRLSNDGVTLYFVRGKAGSNADIYLARRTPQGWSDPQAIAEINSLADDLGPEIGADGASLYFYSNRAGGQGGYDLWMSRRGADGAWREPDNLGPQVNSQFNDYGPALAPDARTLYFSSNRPQASDEREPDPSAWPATLREELYTRTYDLYSAALTDSGAERARPLAALNTTHNEGAPAVSSFGDFLYFASDRPGGSGGFDLYRSRRLRNELQPPNNLGTTINTPSNELDPALSMNGFGLDFSSNRRLPSQVSGAAREYKLYHTNSREVFSETENIGRPSIDWAALWRAVGPNLLWALLALALLLLMLLLFKGSQNRKLSLLAKCVLASLALHMLLMLLFNVWEVAASLAGEFRRGSAIKVALLGTTSPSITAQLTGSLSAVAVPDIQLAALKASSNIESPAPATKVDIPLDRRTIEFADSPRAAVQAIDSSARSAIPPVPEFSAATLNIRANLTLVVPPSAPGTAVPETAINAEIVPPSTSRAVVPLTDATTQAPPAAIEAPPSRAILENSHNAVRLAADQARDAIIESAVPPSLDSQFEPIIALHGTTFAARLPVAPIVQRLSESQETSLPSPAIPASQRQIIDSRRLDDPVAQMVMSFTPPRSRIIVHDASASIPENVLSASESHPVALLPSEAAPAALDFGERTGRAIKIALPETPALQPTAMVEAGSPPLPSKVNSLGKVELSMGPNTASAMNPDPAFQLDRAKISASPRSLLASLSESAGVSPSHHLSITDDEQTPVKISASSAVALVLNLPTDVAPPENQNSQRTVAIRLDGDAPGHEEIAGVIRGTVTNKTTRAPLSSAQVRLVLSDRETLTATTDSAGKFTLDVPAATPDFFALSASLDDFIPQTRSIERDRLENTRKLVVNFALEPENQNTLTTEAAPDVHHLGDDRFSGSINSQFQKKSEGARFSIGFDIAPEILANPLARAEVRLMAKGVQRRHKIFVNRKLLERRLDEAPEDGGFGEFIAPFDPALLVAGNNTLRIEALPSDDDIDDFEFVNIRIYLIPSASPDPGTGTSLNPSPTTTGTQ